MSDYDAIVLLLGSDQPISQTQVVAWMRSEDLRVLGALYVLTDKAWDRIQPPLDKDATCAFILRYYMRCIQEGPSSEEFVLSRYEAAHAMARWIKHLWGKRPETDTDLQQVTTTLKQAYLQGNDAVKGGLVNGVLEHVFEERDLVELFQDWKQDGRLRCAYDAALEWGKAHWKV